jgi:hypothetical protein
MTVLQLATSIDNFIVGCKSDGIWDAIKACCILGAWDNLSGALYPLKGAAPTNVGGLFVAGDYNRKTGLVGDASTKVLNSNRSNSIDPQNSKHLACYVSEISTLPADGVLMGNPYAVSGWAFIISRSNSSTVPNKYEFGLNQGAYPAGVSRSTGFVGASRNNSSNYLGRAATVTATYTATSQTPGAGNVFVFGATAAGGEVNARLAFYSIGESLNLALLDARVNLLMAGIQVGVDGFDADAQAYITNVETADGQPLEFSVKTAINQFVVGCKADGIWNAIKASCILSGARTLAGALQPLVGTAPTNFNFVSGDYNRKTGLVGDGTSKRINTNTPHNIAPQNNAHCSIFASTVHSPGDRAYIAVGSGSFTSLGRDTASPTDTWFIHDTGSGVPRFTDSGTGFKAVSRSSSVNYVRRTGNLTTTVTRTASGTAPSTGTYFLFDYGDGSSFSNARLAFYSIGESLDLALLDARVTALITAFGVAIP